MLSYFALRKSKQPREFSAENPHPRAPPISRNSTPRLGWGSVINVTDVIAKRTMQIAETITKVAGTIPLP
jgi:hypothetical protein